MPSRLRTLRGRLAFWYAAVLSVILIVHSGVLYLVAISDDEPPRASTLKEEQDEVRTAGRRTLIALGIALPFWLCVAVGGGLWIARKGLAPIDEVVRVAGGLGVEELTRRIPDYRGAGEEVERLAHALNGMLDRLEHSVVGIRRFTADASHELRTPISVLMGNLEVALRRPRDAAELRATLEGTLEELSGLWRLTESLLTLARADAGELPLEALTTDARAVTEAVLEPYEAIAAERGISLVKDFAMGAGVRADPVWLGRAIANLVDNACKYTPRGGQVRVTVAATGGKVLITVSDTGPGLSIEDQAHAFQRFYRGAAVRGSTVGFGLGLPLSRDIVRALHGDLSQKQVPEGGTTFCIELPQG